MTRARLSLLPLLLAACASAPPTPTPAPTMPPAAPQAAPVAQAKPGPHLTGPLKTGEPAPALALASVEGKPWSLEDALGHGGVGAPKGVLVAFMASWCGYCEMSLPTLAQLGRDNPDLLIVTVTTDSQPGRQKLEADKVRGAGLRGPVLVSTADAAQRWIGGASVPRYFFIDRRGTITGRDEGFGDQVKAMMPKQAARALRD